MTVMIKLENLSLRVSSNDKSILSNIDFKIDKGDFVIILGSNGSGKSSLLKLMDKRYAATSGVIKYEGIESRNFHRSVKTLTQSTNDTLFSCLTVLENYRLFAYTNKTSQIDVCKYLFQFNVNLPDKLDQETHLLSGGEKQALVLALIMLHPPQVLLLDEHTSALDPKSADNIMRLTDEMIKKHNITCLLATHDLTLAAKYGDRLLALKEGKMYLTLEKPQKSKIKPCDLRALCY